MKIQKKYLVLFGIGMILTPVAVKEAFEVRQAFEFGGEWLLIALFPMMGLVVDSFKELYEESKKANQGGNLN